MLKSFAHLKTRKFLIHLLLFFFLMVLVSAILKEISNNYVNIRKTVIDLSLLSFVITWILFNLRKPGKTLGELLGVNITFSKLEVIAISIGKVLLVFGFTILVILLLGFETGPILGFQTGSSSLYLKRHNLSGHFPFDLIPFIKLVILGPTAEELFFRGFLLQRLSARWGLKTGLFISAVVFAVVHPNKFSGLIAGLLTALIYIKTQNIFAPILYHTLYNVLVFFYYFFISGFAKLESLLHINVSLTIFGLIQLIPGILITGFFIFRLWPVLNDPPAGSSLSARAESGKDVVSADKDTTDRLAQQTSQDCD